MLSTLMRIAVLGAISGTQVSKHWKRNIHKSLVIKFPRLISGESRACGRWFESSHPNLTKTLIIVDYQGFSCF